MGSSISTADVINRLLSLIPAAVFCCGCSTAQRPSSTGTLSSALPGVVSRSVRPGLDYSVWNSSVPCRVHLLSFDLTRSDLRLRPILAFEKVGEDLARDTERLTAMVKRTGAVAAINGDYGGTDGTVEGPLVIDGRIIQTARKKNRASLQIKEDASVVIAVQEPDKNTLQMIGAGPRLMKDGIFSWNRQEDGTINGETFIPRVSRWDQRHPLAAVCVDREKELLHMIVVDGGDPGKSEGMTPWELGDFLARISCDDALRLDGGGSAQMVVGDRMASRPAGDPLGRPLGSALGIFAAGQ